MEEYIVDFSGVTDKKSFHTCLKESLPLPPWYGGNLDALYDALTETEEMCIYFRGWEHLEDSMPSYFEKFRKVLSNAQMEVPGLFCFLEREEETSGVKGADIGDEKYEGPTDIDREYEGETDFYRENEDQGCDGQEDGEQDDFDREYK